MTMDKSLKGASKLVRRRNVLKREERVARLMDDGKWTDQRSVYGLPKVKAQTHMPKGHAKEKKEAAPAAEGAAAEGEAKEAAK